MLGDNAAVKTTGKAGNWGQKSLLLGELQQ